MTDWLTRRRTLGGLAASFAIGLPGCSTRGGDGTTPSSGPAIRSTAFDGPDLVVELRDGHRLDRLTLIGPDGRAVAATAIEPGATHVRLQLLDVTPGPGFARYTPGSHDLVASAGEHRETRTLELRPDVRLVAIEQFREGDGGVDLGRLAITVENVGTGPTWPYAVAYREAPNVAAPGTLPDDPGAPQLLVPTDREDLIVEPGRRVTVVGPTAPLLFVGNGEPRCTGSVPVSLELGLADGVSLDAEVRATLDGEPVAVGLTDEYVCSVVAVERLGGGTSG